MKRLISIIFSALFILGVFGLTSCSNISDDQSEAEVIDYTFIKEYTPNQVRLILENGLSKIYSPESKQDITDGLNLISVLCTPEEVSTLKNSIGVFDDSKKATIEKPSVKIALPSNTDTGTIKILVEIQLQVNGGEQTQLIEFTCNEENLIKSHTIWIK